VLKGILKRGGFQAHAVESAEEGLNELRNAPYDLVILDLGLPGISGMKMCEIIKQTPSTARMPIIMLTSTADEVSKVQGLEMGADDFIVKPPVPAELVARINALLRRIHYAGVPAKILKAAGIAMDLDKNEVTIDGKPVTLRKKEFQLLSLFLEKKGRIVARPFIFDTLWKEDLVTEHTLEVHINHLREKLGPYSRWLQTIPGTGYKFQEPV
jgi:DNA-binding response OmpR family regulator